MLRCATVPARQRVARDLRREVLKNEVERPERAAHRSFARPLGRPKFARKEPAPYGAERPVLGSANRRSYDLEGSRAGRPCGRLLNSSCRPAALKRLGISRPTYAIPGRDQGALPRRIGDLRLTRRIFQPRAGTPVTAIFRPRPSSGQFADRAPSHRDCPTFTRFSFRHFIPSRVEVALKVTRSFKGVSDGFKADSARMM